MSLLQFLLFFVVSFGASIIGAICGIGGGVIIKPALDMFGWASVSTISFLSGCTVLSMSCYSVGKSLIAHDSRVDMRTGTALAIGAAIGGVTGKQMFITIKALFTNPNQVGAVQAFCLMVITIGTLLYTVFKARIRTHHVNNLMICTIIGIALGICSSFLGIGGGPINLVVLYFFFSMDTKTAAENSLYIILFSQMASLIMTVITGTVPEFTWITLILMVAGGIFGGYTGRIINKKIDGAMINKLFIALMVVIILISAGNVWRYF